MSERWEEGVICPIWVLPSCICERWVRVREDKELDSTCMCGEGEERKRLGAKERTDSRGISVRRGKNERKGTRKK